jgi:hypothetical protein
MPVEHSDVAPSVTPSSKCPGNGYSAWSHLDANSNPHFPIHLSHPGTDLQTTIPLHDNRPRIKMGDVASVVLLDHNMPGHNFNQRVSNSTQSGASFQNWPSRTLFFFYFWMLENFPFLLLPRIFETILSVCYSFFCLAYLKPFNLTLFLECWTSSHPSLPRIFVSQVLTIQSDSFL